MMEQKLVEEVHLYCSPLELEEFIQHFCSSFIQKFDEIADLSTFSVEKESDDYDFELSWFFWIVVFLSVWVIYTTSA